MNTTKIYNVKGFIPVTVKNGKQSISHININKVIDIGDYGMGTCISLDAQNSFLVEETVEEVLELIMKNIIHFK